MWLIPKSLSASSPSSPASEGSTSASTSPAETWASRLATSATWRGKHSPSPVWSRRWTAAIWLRRLCSSVTSHPLDTPPPTSSSPASPAPPSPAPESASASRMTAGCGPKSSAPFATREQGSWVSRTSAGSFLPTMEPPSEPFSETWPTSGSMRSGRCFERPTWEPRTDASASSCWATATSHERSHDERKVHHGQQLANQAAMWPTARSEDSESAGRRESRGTNDTLTAVARAMWPTPVANPDAPNSNCVNGPTSLGMAAHLWPTATAGDANSSGGREGSPNCNPGTSLTDAAGLWATPRASISENRTTQNAPSHGTTHGMTLAGQAASWRTPTSTDWKGESARSWQTREMGDNTPRLADQVAAQNWPTPTTRPEAPNASRTRENGRIANRSADQCLETRAVSLSSGLPGPETSPLGLTSSPQTPTSPRGPRLNPTFVTWLMGFPRGWGDPTTWDRPTHGESSEQSHASNARSEEPSRASNDAPISMAVTTSEDSVPTCPRSEPTSRKFWPTPSVGDSESGQSRHSFNARRGGGDSRLRVTAVEVQQHLDLLLDQKPDCLPAPTPSAPSETPSSPHKPDSPSQDCGAGSASA